MDFGILLPKSRQRNTLLLLFQCTFTDFVVAKPMSDKTELRVEQVFEECVYRRFGAPSLIRHDRDPRFVSKAFQAFAEMMQSRYRATLSYRPQQIDTKKGLSKQRCNQSKYTPKIRFIFAINTSMDTTRKETPFYLIHGWDA
ncbi:reverse transcriptase [Phytophthora megakarya]|uniref:Reverse transcriptase n=1 Tax=Phytophthora megakarya TaxID=4795 RepID=A0A225X3A0_9STRA|nr:reverse transcriptase [Phytophthora megakarya]